jgi:CheY-like chemotaxis protein
MRTPSRRRILVVEDDPGARRFVAKLLRQKGYRVVEAAHGRDALDRLQRGTLPCLVLMDLRMPVMDGHDLVRALRGASEWSALPIVATTADPLSAEESGLFQEILPKPVSPEDLLRVVKRYCA